MDPRDAQAHNSLALTYVSTGQLDGAIIHFRQALKIQPQSDQAHANLGNVLSSQGKLTEALKHYRQVVDENMVGLLNGMALILATLPDPRVRNVKDAIRLAERATTITKFKNAMVVNTLAATYLASGQFEKAAEIAENAVALAYSHEDYALADHIRIQLELYRQSINDQ